ncbi:hypothetical protein F5Y19DRAFT_473095 [Xylariaceae sp. FL1651]|nr:hypothetical protein F5Y19DRAFT_473095 [Xylariaceae sp. FL1651]
MAPQCKFYQQGNCRNGASCRFEHPGANADTNPFGAPNANRFNALLNTSSTRSQDNANRYKISKDSIKVDLVDERPTWILSCYGPGKDSPEQLLGGYPREQSLEEVMVHIRGSANPQQAISEVTGLYTQAEQQIQTIISDLDGAVQFVLASENNHPNRIDICKQNTREGGTNGIFAVKTGYADNPLTSNTAANQNSFSTATQSSPFGGGTPSFGQPSTLGQQSNPFGAAPSTQFGQPSQMGVTAPAFGQPSQLGASAPTFGQTSHMGSSAPAFGQPSSLGRRPNPFATASSAPSAFGQAGQPAIGQSSALGQGVNPFGAPATSVSPFSQQSTVPTPSPFARAAPTATSAPSPFGQPAAANPFAQVAATSNDQSMDTSAPDSVPSNPFGQTPNTNPGLSSQTHNPFGAPPSSFVSPASNPFGSVAPQAQPLQVPSAPAAKHGPYAPGSTKQHPPVESYVTKAVNGRLTSFKNQPVVYRWKVNDRYQDEAPQTPNPEPPVPGVRKPDGTWSKILFPDGPPIYNKDTEPDPAQYDATVKEAYAHMAVTGRFRGDMPEVPPMREDCVWTF